MALQEGFRMKQKDNAGRVRDTSRKENENRTGWSVGQEGQDVSGRNKHVSKMCAGCKRYKDDQAFGHQEKLSRKSREHEL